MVTIATPPPVPTFGPDFNAQHAAVATWLRASLLELKQGIEDGTLVAVRQTNANGEATRFADGTQVCAFNAYITGGHTVSAGGGFQSLAPYTWTFPAEFSDNPVINGMIRHTSDSGGVTSWVGIGGRRPQSCVVTLHGLVSNSNDRNVMLTAFGRWK